MEVKCVVTGSLSENCYILSKNGYCVVVDPGDEFEKIKALIKDDKVVGILLTHSHYDHVGALRDVMNLSRKIQLFKKSMLEEKVYTIEDFSFNVIFTPGHSSDSITYYFSEDKVMFTGDFVFKNSVGRWDFPSGDKISLLKSISKIKNYDPDIILYPGHGDKTTLKDEIANNPYFKHNEL
ncbi:MAG: MBL fold metallo-hydrolase [Bacilli bacterium]